MRFGERDVGETYVPADANEWNAWSSPPLVSAAPAGSVNTPAAGTVGTQSAGGFNFRELISTVGGGLIDIFGRPAQPAYVPPPAPAVPMWVYLAIPVALVGMVAMMRRRPAGRMARYRRRRSKR